MKVCPNCGATCVDDVVFCGNCGYNFGSGVNTNSTQQNGYYGSGYYPNMRPRSNSLAVASLVLGIISLVTLCCKGFGGIPGILAIVFGCISRPAIRRSSGRETGMGFSTAGIVMGIISLAIVTLVIIIIVVFGVSYARLANSFDPSQYKIA